MHNLFEEEIIVFSSSVSKVTGWKQSKAAFNQTECESSGRRGRGCCAYTFWIFSRNNRPTQFSFIAAVNSDKQFFHVCSNVHVFHLEHTQIQLSPNCVLQGSLVVIEAVQQTTEEKYPL